MVALSQRGGGTAREAPPLEGVATSSNVALVKSGSEVDRRLSRDVPPPETTIPIEASSRTMPVSPPPSCSPQPMPYAALLLGCPCVALLTRSTAPCPTGNTEPLQGLCFGRRSSFLQVRICRSAARGIHDVNASQELVGVEY